VYTDEELENAILQYLTSGVTLSRSEQGTRDIEAIKAQVYDLISSAFMLRPDALFAVCWLASNNLRALVAAQLEDMRAILAAAPRVSDVSKRVNSTTELRNAEASLLTLTAAFAARSSGVSGAIGPAIQRFNASVGSFIEAELAKNTIVRGDVVQTPEELRAQLAARWASARVRHQSIASAATRFVNALGDYSSVRLPASVVAGLMARIQLRLRELTSLMQSTEAAQSSRQTLLELSAMRVLLAQAAQFKSPALKRCPLAGDAPVGVGSGNTGTPASITGSVSGPFDYPVGSILAYSVGGAFRSVTLPASPVDGQPVDVADVVAELAQDGALEASVERTPPVLFRGRRDPDPGQQARLLHQVVIATDLTADETVVARASINLQALGVEPGMKLVVTSPLSVTRTIRTVDGPRLVLDASVSVLSNASYYIGPDYAADALGSAVQVLNGPDAGTYRVLQGGPGWLQLDRELTSDQGVDVSFRREYLKLTARNVGPSVGITVASTAGASALGLSPYTYPPQLDTFDTSADLPARGVVPGDLLILRHLAAQPTVHRVTAVSGSTVRLDPPAAFEGALPYEIRNPLAQAYNDASRDLAAAVAAPSFTGQEELDQAMGRLAHGARYTGTVAAALTGYIAALLETRTVCDGYVVPRDPTVEQALKLMAEQGFDRAADLFTSLDLATFFNLDADGVSYKTWVVRSAASAAASALPVPKTAQDPTGSLQVVSVTPSPTGSR
jgi:hypothetical protein